MSKIYPEILEPAQLETFGQLKSFRKEGVLAGGTAIALQIKHRKSQDFDIFLDHYINTRLVDEIKSVFGGKVTKLADTERQLTFLTPESIKVTFVYHPYPPLHPLVKTPSIPLFNLKDLASNKAHTIGRRGIWRDYLDLFFLLKDGYVTLSSVITEAEKKFKGEFSGRLLLQQLIYTGDIVDFEIDFVREAYKPNEIINYFQKTIKDYSKKEKLL